jgi:broad specificity phosphatase PhoE
MPAPVRPHVSTARCATCRRRVLSWTALLALAAIMPMLGPLVGQASAQDAVFVVRHAERLDDTKDSPLSVEGRARAAHLADLLRDARITAIFVTQFQRTQQTAQPLADRLKLTPQQTLAGENRALIEKIRAAGPHARVLVVGHGDTVPDILKALGCEDAVTLAKDEYDNLFVVVGGDRPIALRLRF